MNRLIFLAILSFLTQSLVAQQLPLFSQYRENYIAINPAMVSTEYLLYQQDLSFGASYRTQWSGFEGAPETQFIRGEYLYDNNGGFGLLTGGYLINDQTGPIGLTGIYGRIGGIFTGDVTQSGIAVGLTLGAVQYRVNTRELRLRDANDILASDSKTQFHPDVGVGISYYQQLSGFLDGDYIYAGVSIPQALGFNLEFQDEGGKFGIQRSRHFYAQAGLFHLLEGEGYLELSSWAKFVESAPVNVNINLRYQTNSIVWVGVGGSTAGTAHVEAGVQLGENAGFDNTIRIGYGFDYTFSSFGPSVGTTHEVNVSYSLFTY